MFTHKCTVILPLYFYITICFAYFIFECDIEELHYQSTHMIPPFLEAPQQVAYWKQLFFRLLSGEYGFRVRVISPPVGLAYFSQRFSCVFAFSFGRRFFFKTVFMRMEQRRKTPVFKNTCVLVDQASVCLYLFFSLVFATATHTYSGCVNVRVVLCLSLFIPGTCVCLSVSVCGGWRAGYQC